MMFDTTACRRRLRGIFVVILFVQSSIAALVQPPRWDVSTTSAVSASASGIPNSINTHELGNPANPDWIAKLTNISKGLPTSFNDFEQLPLDGDVTTDSDRYQRLARLNLLFPGIFWDKAFPDSQPESCTYDQLNILEMAIRTAVRLSHYEPTNLFSKILCYRWKSKWTLVEWSKSRPLIELDKQELFTSKFGDLLTSYPDHLKQVGLFPSAGDWKGRIIWDRRPFWFWYRHYILPFVFRSSVHRPGHSWPKIEPSWS